VTRRAPIIRRIVWPWIKKKRDPYGQEDDEKANPHRFQFSEIVSQLLWRLHDPDPLDCWRWRAATRIGDPNAQGWEVQDEN
jgi:hypothetical protein